MNVFQYITIHDLYAKAMDDLDINPSHKLKVLNWIGEATEFMQTNSILVPYDEKIEVKDYMCECPCNTINLLGVFKNNIKVHFNNSQKIMDYYDETEENIYVLGEIANELNVYKNGSLHKLEMLKRHSSNSGLTYSQRGKHLHFNFRTGVIDLFYKSLLKNQNGDFLYPDQIEYKECIISWVEYKSIVRGILKGNKGDALAMHKKFKVQAISSIEFPSPEVMQSIVDDNYIFKDNNYDLIL